MKSFPLRIYVILAALCGLMGTLILLLLTRARGALADNPVMLSLCNQNAIVAGYDWLGEFHVPRDMNDRVVIRPPNGYCRTCVSMNSIGAIECHESVSQLIVGGPSYGTALQAGDVNRVQGRSQYKGTRAWVEIRSVKNIGVPITHIGTDMSFISDIDVSSDGQHVAIIGDCLQVWTSDLSASEVPKYDLEEPLVCVEWDTDGTEIVVGSGKGNVYGFVLGDAHHKWKVKVSDGPVTCLTTYGVNRGVAVAALRSDQDNVKAVLAFVQAPYSDMSVQMVDITMEPIIGIRGTVGGVVTIDSAGCARNWTRSDTVWTSNIISRPIAAGVRACAWLRSSQDVVLLGGGTLERREIRPTPP